MSNINNNIDGQLKAQLQGLAEEISELEEKLDKVSKAKDRRKIQKSLDEKKEAYKKLLTTSNTWDTPVDSEETSAPAVEETSADSEEAPAVEETPAPEDTPKETEQPQTPEAPKTQAPKVSAKDTAPKKTIVDMMQDENGKPTTGFSIICYAVLAIVLGAIAWWYFYTDTATVANAAVYERATAQLKEDIEPAWYRWHSWDLEVKGEAIIKWMPAYKVAFVDGDNTSTKGEATLYAVGCAIRALTKKGLSVGDAAARVDEMSNMQLQNVLDNDVTLTASEVRAIKRALEN